MIWVNGVIGVIEKLGYICEVGHIGAQIYICKNGAQRYLCKSGADWGGGAHWDTLGHKYTFVKVEHLGAQICICKSGDTLEKWSMLGHEYTSTKLAALDETNSTILDLLTFHLPPSSPPPPPPSSPAPY